ncbi:MAG: DUF302 domain-containing protein [Sulfuriflexus sp.]|nr:DUF302 domain-containing protein [Sulfuriflexus sp.]
MLRKLILITTLVFTMAANASEPPAIFTAEKKADFEATYQSVYKSLEENKFFVVFEPDIGASVARFGKNWDNYNQNKIERIKSMVFCNGWYANKVSNVDPKFLALCPLRLTMTHKQGVTSVLFVRPDFVAKGSKAEAVAKEITQGVIEAIEQGMR